MPVPVSRALMEILMANQARPIIRLKGHELVPADEDRKVEIGVFDVLLPCRKYEVAYKVAILGKVSQSLEFLLRLVKTVPGIAEDAAAAFFGYTQTEIIYVLNEATGPGFVQRSDGRLWLTAAGEALFHGTDDDPAIFSVEARLRDFGFDLLAVAPQPPRFLDTVEQVLPEIPIIDAAAAAKVADRVLGRFGRFFHELSERRDKEQIQHRDLYSVDRVVPKDRFQVPVRIRVYAQASAPSLPEIDLNAWRDEHEMSDRPQIESAAAKMVDDLRIHANQVNAPDAYNLLAELAPDFLKEYVTRSGFNERRYWREAVGRAGEARSNRKTIPIVGPLYTDANAKRLFDVLEYGLRGTATVPELILAVAPQTSLWGATTQQRDTLSYLRQGIATTLSSGDEIQTVCLFTGKPGWYIEKAFDILHLADTSNIPAALELLVIPNVAAAAVVHAPIGATSGYAVPLGWASFENSVVARTQAFVRDRIRQFVRNEDLQKRFEEALQTDLIDHPEGD